MCDWSPPNHCQRSILWVSMENGHVPAGAIIGGQDKDGGALYVGRAFHSDDLVPCKISTTHCCAYLPYRRKEVKVNSYDTNSTTQPIDMAPPRGTQTQLCMKVFVQRDYSDGTTVKFQSLFPPELEGKLDRQAFDNTVGQLNAYFREAEKGTCSTYCEGCMACLTAYLMYICAQTHYEKCLRKIAKFVQEQNERVYRPRGLLLTNPVERGLRVIEISILDQPMVSRT